MSSPFPAESLIMNGCASCVWTDPGESHYNTYSVISHSAISRSSVGNMCSYHGLLSHTLLQTARLSRGQARDRNVGRTSRETRPTKQCPCTQHAQKQASTHLRPLHRHRLHTLAIVFAPPPSISRSSDTWGRYIPYCCSFSPAQFGSQ